MISWHEEDNLKIKGKIKHRRQIFVGTTRHIPLVSLLLWHEIVAIHCFVWPLALQAGKLADKILSDGNKKIIFVFSSFCYCYLM